MAVQPPLPSRVPSPERMENMGEHREMAAILDGSLVWPMKKVSAIL